MQWRSTSIFAIQETVKGSGLGPAIVKRIVELRQSKAGIEKNPEDGSVFCVEIPKN